MYIRTLQLHIAVTLLHQLVGERFDDEGFAASGRSVEEEGLYR